MFASDFEPSPGHARAVWPLGAAHHAWGRLALTGLILVLALWLSAAQAQAGPVRTQVLAQGLEHPWALAFIGPEQVLVSERAGRLRVVGFDGRISAPLQGLPDIDEGGQGGLLDVISDSAFASNRTIYFCYSEPAPAGGGNSTALASARLSADLRRLEQVRVLFRQSPKVGSRHHFGCRIVEAPDGHLFLTLGDRFSRMDDAQTLDNHHGKVVRIRKDGGVPPDNPFVQRVGARPEIWSYGHRNPQGAAIRPGSSELWINEHGPQGGDELNRIIADGNYGWPLVSYGCNYGDPVGDACRIGGGIHAPTYVEPVSYWVPTSIAPAGLLFYTGGGFPQWKGNAFMGALAGAALWRVVLNGNTEVSRERLFSELGERIRDVEQGPDGWIYLLTDSGKLIQIRSAKTLPSAHLLLFD